MKVDSIIFSLVPLLWAGPASGYVTPGGGRFYGRMHPPMTPEQKAELRRQQAEFVNRAFDSLANEVNKEATRRAGKPTTGGQKNPDKEFMENAFGFASGLFQELGAISDDSDEAKQFRDLASKGMGIARDAMDGSYSPAYEIDENEDMFEISIDLPGVEKSKIDILVEENVLTISGERDMGKEKAKPVPFSKSFRLNKSIDKDKITASLDSGVLLVRALKKKAEKPPGKRIPVL